MSFTSIAFLKFFIVFLAGLWLLPKRRLRQIFILAASAVFYGYAKSSYLLVLAVPSIVAYYSAIRIEGTEGGNRKFWVAVSAVVNLGLLAYFKYTNFFLANVSHLFHWHTRSISIILPIGISFYTFKSLSYVIDVYRREFAACRSLIPYAMYMTYFPELVAGPIVRGSVFLPQIERSLRPSWSRAGLGFQMVLLGLTKKLLIADKIAGFVDVIFAHPSSYSPATVASAVVGYSFQIYCDFSGYSDMAIGISKVIGYDLPENFNMPYLSISIIDFWHRWHITLSTWLRDYLYFSIGGLRKNKFNKYRNLLITMVLIGLWHGANWTFVAWGSLHGLALCVNHFWQDFRRSRGLPVGGSRSIQVLSWAVTYTFVCFSWVLFRSPNFSIAIEIYRKLIGLAPGGVVWFCSTLFMLVPLIVLGHLFGAIAARQAQAGNQGGYRILAPSWLAPLYARCKSPFAIRPRNISGIYVLAPWPGFIGSFVLGIWILVLLLFGAIQTSPFIYFQF
jgi:alginate O-acetyltransferase complex protein AlgI